MEIIWIPPGLRNFSPYPHTMSRSTHRCDFDLGDFRYVVFVIHTISEDIAKIPKSTLQGIGCPLFLRFFESRSFPLAILCVAVSDVLQVVNK